MLVPAAAGVLSALGLVVGDERRDHVRSLVRPLADAGELPPEGEASLRYRGQSFELSVPLGPELEQRFHRAHEERYGYADRGRPVELVAVRWADVVPGPVVDLPPGVAPRRLGAGARGARRCDLLGPGRLGGRDRRPWDARVGAAMIEVELQVIGSALRAVAEEMGAALIRAAFSSNIKERRDCSTALFDGAGRMVVQAEHIPVHLGAMPDAVAAVMAHDPAPGEVWALNDPYAGGTHLPDITLVSRTELGFAVSRAHHADVGGIEPASLPAFSTDLFQEGLVIPPTRLDDELVEHIARSSRNPDERRGDLRAQLAAHRLAERRTAEIVSRRGRGRVERAMDELYAYSERRVRAGLAGLPDGRFEAERDRGRRRRPRRPSGRDHRRRRGRDRLHGTAAQHRGNSTVRSGDALCVLLRRPALTDPDVPASGGAFETVTVVAPEGCLVNARFPAAVVAGNTETSSRITDVVPAAFGRAVDVPAMGQGTMNNTTLGTEYWTYSRRSAEARRVGASRRAVRRARRDVERARPPVEALELSYPLRVERYAVKARLEKGLHSSRRRRRDPRDPGARGLSSLRPRRPSASRTARSAGRRGGPARP